MGWGRKSRERDWVKHGLVLRDMSGLWPLILCFTDRHLRKKNISQVADFEKK